MDWFGWFGLVVFCSWWIRGSTVGMGRKFLFELIRASPILMEMGYWDIVCVLGLSLLYFLFLPYLWQDRKMLERARLLAPQWSGL